MELADLFRQMARARAFEEAVARLWEQGAISGEMHLGTGEEAVAAGVVTHLRPGDGLSLAHRCSPALVVRGVPLVAMLRELLGREDGLCRGRGGHMHLFSREHLAASSGIVGASLPVGAGLALAAKRLRKGAIAAALTGDGAMNQGMALGTLNLAAAWQLPLLAVCIDNGWAITTTAGAVTGGELPERVRAFGWSVGEADGVDVQAVHRAAGELIACCRRGKGPALLYVTCPRLDGHILGDPLLRQARNLTGEDAKQTASNVVSAAFSSGGGGVGQRAGSMLKVMGVMAKARLGAARGKRGDPLQLARKTLRKTDGDRLEQIEREVAEELGAAVEAALAEGGAHA